MTADAVRPGGESLPREVVLASLAPEERATLAAALRRAYDGGSALRALAGATGLAYSEVRMLVDEAAPRGRGLSDAEAARIAELVERGALSEPGSVKRTPPEPVAGAAGGLSALVVAERG